MRIYSIDMHLIIRKISVSFSLSVLFVGLCISGVQRREYGNDVIGDGYLSLSLFIIKFSFLFYCISNEKKKRD